MRIATTGAAASSESIRSSTPPCPGRSVPESFTPARRLSQLSRRSPPNATGPISTAARPAQTGMPKGAVDQHRDPRPAKGDELREREDPGDDEDRREHDGRCERGHENDRCVDGRGDRPPRKVAHYFPKRRSRSAYEVSAASRSVTEKSGQSTCVAHISEYATSQRRKFETRSSPPVLINRSGSGWSGA